jgi:hypothetical protein
MKPVGERTREERVTFRHAFSFPGVEEQAPGTYVVEIVEETIDTLSFVAYRRVSTTIVLPSPQFGYASKQVVAIEPHDLAAAGRTRSIDAASDSGQAGQ